LYLYLYVLVLVLVLVLVVLVVVRQPYPAALPDSLARPERLAEILQAWLTV
jgi:hypothetical protein